jgi:hypothetical protein
VSVSVAGGGPAVTAYPRPDRPTQKTRPCLSPDYQVFIVSRMREAYDRTGSTPTAVVEGIGRTGRLKGKTRTSTTTATTSFRRSTKSPHAPSTTRLNASSRGSLP